jgi:hypothetical protein
VVHQTKEPGLSVAVERLCHEYLNLTYQASPMTATAYGEHGFDDLLDDLTEENLDLYTAELGRLALGCAGSRLPGRRMKPIVTPCSPRSPAGCSSTSWSGRGGATRSWRRH